MDVGLLVLLMNWTDYIDVSEHLSSVFLVGDSGLLAGDSDIN